MFKQLDKNIEDKIRASGFLSIELVTRGINYDNCNITYNRNVLGVDVVLRRLFTCSICYTKDSMLLWGVNWYESDPIKPDEAEQFLFLQMLIEDMEKWAIKSEKKQIGLSSDLSHVSEIMVDKGFSLRVIGFTTDIQVYSGTKVLSKSANREEQ